MVTTTVLRRSDCASAMKGVNRYRLSERVTLIHVELERWQETPIPTAIVKLTRYFPHFLRIGNIRCTIIASR